MHGTHVRGWTPALAEFRCAVADARRLAAVGTSSLITPPWLREPLAAGPREANRGKRGNLMLGGRAFCGSYVASRRHIAASAGRGRAEAKVHCGAVGCIFQRSLLARRRAWRLGHGESRCSG